MNYYIQGDAANAEQIKAAFKSKGFIKEDSSDICENNVLFFTVDDDKNVHYCWIDQPYCNIIKTHPEYKELELSLEPKFKMGDWVVTNYGKVSQVVSVDNDGDGYTLDDGVYFSGSWCDMYHLWSIADAKKGDVLHLGCIIAIFKKYIGQEKCICYCSISEDGDFEIPIKNGEDNVYGCTNTTPATKEQRDQFFAKIKEAGYQWDGEKKELKKIPKHYDISNFKPFDKVLIRVGNKSKWTCDFFSYYHKGFHCIGTDDWSQCIPYNDDTKHLLGTTDMCPEEYINW